MATIKENKTAPTTPPSSPTLGTDVEYAEVRSTGPAGPNWFEKNAQLVLGVVGAGLLIALGIFLYNKFVSEPARAEAAADMWQAEQLFEQDSFQVAVQGRPGVVMGFLNIIDDHGGTPSGNLARYYTGVSYLHLGQYDAAIDYLEDFDADGTLLPATKAGALGDAYAQKGDLAKAESYYEDAVDAAADNLVTAPYFLKKLGMLRERNGDKASASELYVRIREEFPNSEQAGDIEKFVARASAQ